MNKLFLSPLLLLVGLLSASAFEVTTTRSLSLPVMINGQEAGSVSIPVGSSVETDGVVAADHTVPLRRGELSTRVDASALNLPSSAIASPTPVQMATPIPVSAAASSGGDLPVLSILEDHAITVLNDHNGRTATVSLKVVPSGFPPGAQLTYSWKQIQDTMSPDAVDMKAHPAEFSTSKAESTTVTFKDWGVYAVRVTVTDAVHGISASRNAWINVWDNHSHIIIDGKPDPLSVAPGIAPPPHVRAFGHDSDSV
jgi:hypothetical protein